MPADPDFLLAFRDFCSRMRKPGQEGMPAPAERSAPPSAHGAAVSDPPQPDLPTIPPSDTTIGGDGRQLPNPYWPVIEGYEIVGLLGRGGMGVVYKAHQKKLNRPVALKMVLAGQYAGPEALARFMREVSAVAQLQHPHIVHVYDLGETGGQPYFAMEYVDGGCLTRRIRDEPCSDREAAEIIANLARAMHSAHERGVIHRDLKPANVLLSRDGVPKITDFGLAKRSDPDVHLTVSGTVLGTPGYLSPEQAEGKSRDVGPATDIYSLGVMLYELLTGRRPFQGESEQDLLDQIRTQPAPSPACWRPGIPRDLEFICLRCLEKDPVDRYASAGELAHHLQLFLNGKPVPDPNRRVSAAERLVRWMRQWPMGITLAAFVLASFPRGALVRAGSRSTLVTRSECSMPLTPPAADGAAMHRHDPLPMSGVPSSRIVKGAHPHSAPAT